MMEAKNPYRTKRRPNNSYATIYERGHKAGMKEVVEWLEDNGDIEVDYTDDMHLKKCELTIPWHKLQAFLKEKGIEQNEGGTGIIEPLGTRTPDTLIKSQVLYNFPPK